MRYLILYNNESFFTNWFLAENNYETGMIVFDLTNSKFTSDGENWKEIETDNL